MSQPPEEIARALALCRSGDLAGARAEGEAALARDGENFDLLAFFGVLSCRSGELAPAPTISGARSA